MILDTNALTAFVDGDAAVGAVLRTQPRAALPVIVLGEYRYGIAGSRHKAAYEQWLTSYLDQFDVIPITADTTVVYASVRLALKTAGRAIPANDVWIAATAHVTGATLLTTDADFDHLMPLFLTVERVA